jgi:hypothetical protein
MEIRKELITPEIAKKLLEMNDNNRRIRPLRYSRYAKDMKEGRWLDDTAEMIKITKGGKLADGQNRMMAVVIANIPIFFHVAYGLEDSVFPVLDTGASRNATDVFKIAGVKNDSQIPSIINNFNILKTSYQRSQQINKTLTNAELLAQYDLDPEFWQFVFRKTASWYDGFSKIIPMSTIGGMFATFYHIHKEDAVDFMDQLCKGINVKNPSIELLRKRLIQEKLSNKKTTVTFRNVLIIKVWNFYRNNQSVKTLKFIPETESFPKPI